MSTAQGSAFAVLTPPGRGGIAVIRCVGPKVEVALRSCFRPSRAGAEFDEAAGAAQHPRPGRLAYGHVVDGDGRTLDEVIVCRLPETPAGGAARPPVLEVNCHGGPAAVAAVCGRLASLGLTQVDADRLLEAEGVPGLERQARRLLRAARTPFAARVLLDQLDGALGRAMARAGESLACGRPAVAQREVAALLARWRACGRFLAEPPRIVIAGRPNVGKSTLLNRLVGADRAITSAAPGTTRDYVEADAAIECLPVILVDTAGLRQAQGEIERIGVERAHGQAARADLVAYLLDAAAGMTAEDAVFLGPLGDRALVVWNKADVAAGPLGPPGVLGVSALTGSGMAALAGAVLSRLGFTAPSPGDAVPFTAEQARALAEAERLAGAGQLDAARQALEALL